MKYKTKHLKASADWLIDNHFPHELEIGKTYKLTMFLMPQSEDECICDNHSIKEV